MDLNTFILWANITVVGLFLVFLVFAFRPLLALYLMFWEALSTHEEEGDEGATEVAEGGDFHLAAPPGVGAKRHVDGDLLGQRLSHSQHLGLSDPLPANPHRVRPTSQAGQGHHPKTEKEKACTFRK